MASIRKVKKLLQKYPPIVELHVFGDYDPQKHKELAQRFASFNEKHNTNFLFFFIPLPEDSPMYKIDFNPDIGEDKLEEFKKKWLKEMQNPANMFKLSSSPSVSNIEMIPNIHIHSVVKLGLNGYKKKLQNLLNDVDTEKTTTT